MSQTGTIVLAVLVAASLMASALFYRAHAQSKPQGKADPAIYHDLRSRAFAASRTELGLSAGATATEPWGVVMDSSFKDGGSYTVVAIADGNASIYLSSGGGFIGGVGHENVRKAAKAMVATAKTFQPQMAITTSYPLPKGEYVAFYVFTDAGIFTATATEVVLGQNQHALSPLFHAAHEVITQYRLISQRQMK